MTNQYLIKMSFFGHLYKTVLTVIMIEKIIIKYQFNYRIFSMNIYFLKQETQNKERTEEKSVESYIVR